MDYSPLFPIKPPVREIVQREGVSNTVRFRRGGFSEPGIQDFGVYKGARILRKSGDKIFSYCYRCRSSHIAVHILLYLDYHIS